MYIAIVYIAGIPAVYTVNPKKFGLNTVLPIERIAVFCGTEDL